MAEILALGISHYPPLSGHDDRMAAILQRMMQNPDLPLHLRILRDLMRPDVRFLWEAHRITSIGTD